MYYVTVNPLKFPYSTYFLQVVCKNEGDSVSICLEQNMKNISNCEPKFNTCIPILLKDLYINWLGAHFAIHFKLNQWRTWM